MTWKEAGAYIEMTPTSFLMTPPLPLFPLIHQNEILPLRSVIFATRLLSVCRIDLYMGFLMGLLVL